MSDEPTAGAPSADAHAAEEAGHGATDAHDAHGGHGGPALGPIDWRAYGAGFAGAALGLVVAAVLAVTTGYVVL
jgi:hypothetical protein